MLLGSAAMRFKGQAELLFFSSRNSLPAEKSGWKSWFLISQIAIHDWDQEVLVQHGSAAP